MLRTRPGDPLLARPQMQNRAAETKARKLGIEMGGLPGIIVPTRAESRVVREREGLADEAFAERLIFRKHLPTGTSNTSGQWYWVDHMRYLHGHELLAAHDLDTPEMCRGLMAHVQGRAPFTAAQVGQVVGSGVHHDTAVFTAERALTDIEPADGNFRYASAYTGVDSTLSLPA